MIKEVNMRSWAVWSPIILTLLSGTAAALGKKVIFETPIEGREGCGKTKFQKAYWFTLCMFIGEMMCLVYYYARKWWQKRQQRSSLYDPLVDGGREVSPRLSGVNQVVPTEPEGKKPPLWVYAVLCIFDLAATSAGGVGLIWVDASTNQMLRGSMVVYTALFSVLLLKRRLSGKQWGSIGIVCVGLVLVGLSGMLQKHYESEGESNSSSVSSGQLLVGILLELLASALNALQGVFEERLLKATGSAEVDPLELVGWEGLFGTIFSAFILLPIVHAIPGGDCGRAEDSIHTLVQLGNSGLAVFLSIFFAVSLFFMNWQSQEITQVLSAVHRNLVSASRTVLVWVGAIILFYATRHNEIPYGEEWSNWTLVQLAGFLLLVLGSILYSYYGVQHAAQQKALAAQAAAEEELEAGSAPVMPYSPAEYGVPPVSGKEAVPMR